MEGEKEASASKSCPNWSVELDYSTMFCELRQRFTQLRILRFNLPGCFERKNSGYQRAVVIRLNLETSTQLPDSFPHALNTDALAHRFRGTATVVRTPDPLAMILNFHSHPSRGTLHPNIRAFAVRVAMNV